MERGLAALLAGYIVSVAGDWIFKIAIPIIIFRITGSPLLMAAAFACSFAPYVIMMPIGGALADALRRQKVLYVGDFASAAITVALSLYLSLGGTNVYVLFPAIFTLGMVSAIYHPAFQGFLPSVVASAGLPRANSYFTASDNILNFAGPMLAGALIVLFDPTIVIWSNAASFAISGVLIFSISPHTPEIAKAGALSIVRVKHDLTEGFQAVWNEPVIRWGTIIFIGENLATNMILGNEIYYLTVVLGYSPSVAGVLIGLSAAAAVAGSLVAPWIVRSLSPGRTIVGFMVVIAVGTAILLLAPSIGAAAVVIGRGLVMTARAIIIVTMFTYRQRAFPQGMLSRVVAIQRTIAYIAVPVAAVVGGYILSTTNSMQLVIGMSVAVLLVSTMIGFMSPLMFRPPANSRTPTVV
jgi:Na+/melibiose symporter-like transporter